MRSYVVAAGISSMLMMGCGGSSPTLPTPTTPTPPVPTPPTVVTTPAPPVVVRGPDFSQTFWDMFVHNSLNGPFQPLKRFTEPPMLYIRTTDGAGRPMDQATLDITQAAMLDVVNVWGGGLISLRGVDRGTANHVGDTGWIVVNWFSEDHGNLCGDTRGGEIDLNYLHSACGCGGSQIAPVIVRHELGHAFGYYHTDSGSDVMYGGTLTRCDGRPSARETYHAKLAYQSPNGTTN